MDMQIRRKLSVDAGNGNPPPKKPPTERSIPTEPVEPVDPAETTMPVQQ